MKYTNVIILFIPTHETKPDGFFKANPFRVQITTLVGGMVHYLGEDGLTRFLVEQEFIQTYHPIFLECPCCHKLLMQMFRIECDNCGLNMEAISRTQFELLAYVPRIKIDDKVLVNDSGLYEIICQGHDIDSGSSIINHFTIHRFNDIYFLVTKQGKRKDVIQDEVRL